MAASASLILRWLSRQGRALIFFAGLAAISVGIGWIYLPGGVIAAGLFASLAVLLEQAGAAHEQAGQAPE